MTQKNIPNPWNGRTWAPTAYLQVGLPSIIGDIGPSGPRRTMHPQLIDSPGRPTGNFADPRNPEVTALDNPPMERPLVRATVERRDSELLIPASTLFPRLARVLGI